MGPAPSAPSDRVTALPRHAGDRPPALDAAGMAQLFGLPDLPERLAAVDERITAVLGHDGALLGPASVRVASSGGKRLRPLFTIVSAATGGVFDDRVVDAAAAVELVQVGSLVHDDILDDAATRRGRPTINAVEGVNHAVMAGDYILARAAELAAGVSQEPPLPVVVELAKGVEPDADLADRIKERLRAALVFSAAIELAPFGTLERSEYKSKLVRH